MDFQFRDSKEVTGNLPLLIGLIAPSGGGKTLSALKLATGIQRVRGGKIVGIDSEAKRMRHYSNDYSFRHLEFTPPFSSLRYRDALTAAVKESENGVVIVDSMSHEHNGEGGYLDFHESEVDRLVSNSKSNDPDWKKRERVNMLAWVKPASGRTSLINAILRSDAAFIFCFRAKEKLKLVSGKEPESLGWQPVAGEEFSFEMTFRCLLPPGSNGVPDWSPEAFKNHAAKRAANHAHLIPNGQALDEATGERLARWASGGNQLAEILSEARKAANKGNAALDLFLKGNVNAKLIAGYASELRTTAKAADESVAQETAPANE